jgi:hypothetical protein
MSDGIVPLTPTQTVTQEQQAAKDGYLHRDAVGLDEFINVLTDGHLDETISSRAARAAVVGNKWGIDMSKFLDIFQKDHGPKAVSGDLERAEADETLEEDSGTINK